MRFAVWPMGEGGCLKRSQLPPPNRPGIGRRPSIHGVLGNSTATAAVLAVAVLATHEAIPHRGCAAVGLNREDVQWAKYRSNNDVGL